MSIVEQRGEDIVGVEDEQQPGNGQPARKWPEMRYWVRVAAAFIAVVVTLLLVLALQGVLLLIVASLVLAIGLQPPIDFLVRHGLKRGPALAVLFGGLMVVIIGVLWLIIPIALEQASRISERLPEFRRELTSAGGVGPFIADRLDFEQVVSADMDVTSTVGTVAATAFNIFTVLVLTPYFAFAFPGIKRWAFRLMYREDRPTAMRLLNDATDKISGYIIGNLTVSAIAGVVTGLGLWALGVPSWIVLAGWIAFTDLIPIVGAFVGAIPAIAIAGLEGVGLAVAVAGFLLSYQLLENYVISPQVMKEAIDLSPAAVIIALMIGSTLVGFLGALLALPLAAMVKLGFQTYVLDPRIDAVRDAVTVDESRSVGRTRHLP